MQIITQQQKQKSKSIKLLSLSKQNEIGKLGKISLNNDIVPFNYILQPYQITNDQLDKIKQFGYLWQKLTHLASKDFYFIINTLSKIQQDPLIDPMLKICKKLYQKQTVLYHNLTQNQSQKTKQNQCNKNQLKDKIKPYIELFRADFFITNQPKDNIKLVQYNNVSVSMAAMSERFVSVQKLLWGEQKNIQSNNSLQTYARGVANFYIKYKLQGIFLAVIQSQQKNIFDQNILFSTIKQYTNIEIIKVKMEEFDESTYLDSNGDLYYKQNKKIAIVYYRSGYSSRQKISWNAIQKANLSNAINIPAVNAYLVNSKKMQAQLSKQQIMSRYLSKEQTKYLLGSVVDTWDFSEKMNRDEVVKIIQRDGEEEFVLKPNEEGGKNNIFGKNVLKKIKQLPDKELLHYILTRKIHPRSQKCTFISAQKWQQPTPKYCQIQSQVSIFGCVCSICECSCIQNCCVGNSMTNNKQYYTVERSGCKCLSCCCSGYLVRSKPCDICQGGIMSGTGAFCALEVVDKLE